MSFQRRDFLKLTGSLAAGFALQSAANKVPFLINSNKKTNTFGLQLYTVRDEMPKDPKGVLKQIASYGYKQIESFEGTQGMFWGMTNTDFKKYLDDVGLTIVSSHCDYKKDFEKKV